MPADLDFIGRTLDLINHKIDKLMELSSQPYLAVSIPTAGSLLEVSRGKIQEIVDSGQIKTVDMNRGLPAKADKTGEKKDRSRYRRVPVDELKRYLVENMKGPMDK